MPKGKQGFQKGNQLGKMNKGKKGHIPWNKGKKTGLVPKTAFQKGHKHTEEWKRMMSKRMRGRVSPFLGKHHTEAYKIKMSKIYRGENSHNWRGGITPENKRIRNSIEFRLWREAVFARDNWACQKTGKQGMRLHAHHIQNFSDHPELRFAIDNGITLSEEAHREFHRKYGINNNTKEQLEEFLAEVNGGS